MSQQEFEQHRRQEEEPAPAGPLPGGSGGSGAAAQGFDDLLDEIDSVLETDAESFVRGFVQKGGQ